MMSRIQLIMTLLLGLSWNVSMAQKATDTRVNTTSTLSTTLSTPQRDAGADQQTVAADATEPTAQSAAELRDKEIDELRIYLQNAGTQAASSLYDRYNALLMEREKMRSNP